MLIMNLSEEQVELWLAETANPGEAVVRFYHLLGWDGQAAVDPQRVEVSDCLWRRICNRLMQRYGLEGGLLWMDSGPSVGQGQGLEESGVRVLEGAFSQVLEATATPRGA